MHLTLLNSFLAEANCLEYKKKLCTAVYNFFCLINQLNKNSFRTERGCVLITQQNLQKFEFFYCSPLNIQIFVDFAG